MVRIAVFFDQMIRTRRPVLNIRELDLAPGRIMHDSATIGLEGVTAARLGQQCDHVAAKINVCVLDIHFWLCMLIELSFGTLPSRAPAETRSLSQ
jgi:hypothetical protein